MVELSIKSQMLYYFKDEQEMWENDCINRVLERDGKVGNDYWTWTCRFYLMELSTNGLLEPMEQKIDDTGVFGENHSLTRYRLTDYGKYKIETMLE